MKLRVLGIDHGQKRIGIALSDTMGMIASPLTTIEHTSDAADINAVITLIEKNSVCEIVVGIPISLDGSIGNQAKRAAYFARLIAKESNKPVETIDERFSTQEAKRKIAEIGRQRSKDKGRLDSAAAAVLLQSYLDSRPRT